jgi:hypothetical protein
MLVDAQKTLNREISPTVFRERISSQAAREFPEERAGEKKLFIIADENVLRELGDK